MAGRTIVLPHESSKHPLMSSKDAALYCGMSVATFRRRVTEQMVAYLQDRVTNRRRYRREDLDAFVETAFDYHAAKPVPDPLGRTARSAQRKKASR